jgi:transposase-like protein
MKTPTTLLEAVAYFSDLKRAHEHFEAVRWPKGAVCPRKDCQSKNVGKMSAKQGRRRWRCRACRRDFTAKVGTIFEDSPLGLDKWLPTIWMLSSMKNGISSMELSRALGVTQKTAWFMLHRVRVALKLRSFDKLTGEVEADETFVGGRLRHKRRTHYHIASGMKPVGPVGKTPVLGIMKRGGEFRGEVLKDVRKKSLLPILYKNIDFSSNVYTDSLQSYRNLGQFYRAHEIVNHAVEYVRGNAHVNNVECFWAVLKRGLGGTYVCPSPEHLERYLDEHIFRFNTRKDKDAIRFNRASAMVEGKRIMYRDLIKHLRPRKAR